MKHCVHISSFLVFCLLFLSATSQNKLIDSLEKRLPQLKGKERRTALADLSWEYNSIDVSKSEAYARELYTLALETKDSTEVGEACNFLTVALYRKGDYEQALQFNRRAYRIRKANGDKKGMGSSLNKFVNIYTDQVRLDSALKYAIECVKIFEELKDSANTAICINTLSGIYQKERNWTEMEKSARQSYDIARKIGFDYAKGGAAGNMAAAMENTNRLDEAIKWYAVADSAFTAIGSDLDRANVLLNLGVLYRKQGNREQALKNYTTALEMLERVGEKHGIAHASANVGLILNAMGKNQEAVAYFQKALPIAESERLGRVELMCYEGLLEANMKLGNSTEAISFFNKYAALRDTLYSSERATLMSEMRTKFEVEKKEQENAFLKNENELKEKQKRNVLIGSIIIIVLLIFAGVLYYLAYRRKQESKLQQEVIRERERGLAAVFEATEEERKRIAKDLHDGIGQQLSGLRMNWESFSEGIHDENQKARLQHLSGILDEACKDVRTISHQMMPRVLTEGGLLPALQEMLSKSFALAKVRYRIEHFKVEGERFNERVELGLYRICQELINNIIKHSGADDVVIQLYRNKNQLILIVEDNGKGFDVQQKRDGIGLMNITSRLSTVGGDVIWEPGPQSGSVATVRIPLNDEKR